MPCGCDVACNCYLNPSNTVSVPGDGTVGTPWVPSVIPDPTGGIYATINGVAILIDPASPATISTSAAGLSVACCPVAVVDSDTIDFSLPGGAVSGDVRIDPAGSAPVSSSAAGLKIDCCDIASTLTVTDTESIDLTLAAGNLSADIINDPDGGLTTVAAGEAILMPQYRAHRNAGGQAINSGGSIIAWDTEDDDIGFGIAVGSTLAVPSTGLYMVVAQVRANFQDADDNDRVSILINGTAHATNRVKGQTSNAADSEIQCTLLQRLTAGDDISVEAAQSTNTTASAGTNSTWVSIVKLST